MVANGKVNEAEEVIRKIARINKTQVPDASKLRYLVENFVSDENKKYTYFDVLRNKESFKKTVLLAVCWYVYILYIVLNICSTIIYESNWLKFQIVRERKSSIIQEKPKNKKAI